MTRAPAYPQADTAAGAAPAAGWGAPSTTDEGEDDLWGAAAASLCSDPAVGSAAMGPQPAPCLEAAALLGACAAEATRLAAAMSALDTAVAASLGQTADRAAASGDPGMPAAAPPITDTLQRVDLLRQELDGLARALGIVSGHVACRKEIELATLGAVLPLAAQRRRLLGTTR